MASAFPLKPFSSAAVERNKPRTIEATTWNHPQTSSFEKLHLACVHIQLFSIKILTSGWAQPSPPYVLIQTSAPLMNETIKKNLEASVRSFRHFTVLAQPWRTWLLKHTHIHTHTHMHTGVLEKGVLRKSGFNLNTRNRNGLTLRQQKGILQQTHPAFDVQYVKLWQKEAVSSIRSVSALRLCTTPALHSSFWKCWLDK